MESETVFSKNKVAYYYDEILGCFNYASGHPMKPLKVAMTDSLIREYKLDEKMTAFVFIFR